MDILLIFTLTLAFCSTFLATIWWRKRAEKAGLVGRDMNKHGKRLIPEMGGVPVLFGFIIGTMAFLGYRTLILKSTEFNIELLGAIGTICIIAIIGILDDILGWKLGLRQYQKPLLCLIAALPLVMAGVGSPIVTLPFLGTIDLGVFYFLFVIPIAVSGAANAFNMVAGYNGLEAGMGIIILSTLGFIVWTTEGLSNVAMLAGIMSACLLAFLFFNLYPAMIFPGNSLSYPVGALIAVVAILGNTEKIALFLFLPYFLQFFLKARGGWKKEGFSREGQDGSLMVPTKRSYGIEHLIVRMKRKLVGRVSEMEVVIWIFMVELSLVILVLADIGFG